jgi:hypothetical protein
MKTSTETFVSMNNVTSALMNLSERYQDRVHYIETLALKLCACNWWEFSKKRELRKKILEHVDSTIKEDFIKEHFINLL